MPSPAQFSSWASPWTIPTRRSSPLAVTVTRADSGRVRELASAVTATLPAPPRTDAFWTSNVSRPTRTGRGRAVNACNRRLASENGSSTTALATGSVENAPAEGARGDGAERGGEDPDSPSDAASSMPSLVNRGDTWNTSGPSSVGTTRPAVENATTSRRGSPHPAIPRGSPATTKRVTETRISQACQLASRSASTSAVSALVRLASTRLPRSPSGALHSPSAIKGVEGAPLPAELVAWAAVGSAGAAGNPDSRIAARNLPVP